MKTLIIYASKHGTTEQCALKLSEKLKGKVEVFNIKNGKTIDFTECDKVIIGGSIYAGKIQKEINKFCLDNLDALKSKKVGLFICCISKNDAEKQISSSFPQELLNNAVAKQSFGGEFKFNKMNFVEKIIVKMVSKSLAKTDDRLRNLDMKKDISMISEENIIEFSGIMSSK